MSNNTSLNIGQGGDVIATEDTGLGYKIPVSKIRIGGLDIDGGDVTISNPFPTLISDGYHQASVKGPFTPAVPGDSSIVVSLSPNFNPNTPIPVTLGSPGSQDIFGHVVSSQRLSQVQAQFFTNAPSYLLNIITSGSATSSQVSGTGVFSTGTSATSQITANTFNTVAYSAHYEIYAAMTAAFTIPTDPSSYQRLGLYNSSDGFSFGYNGTIFGLWTRYNTFDTFIPQSSWNMDTLSGSSTSKFTNNSAPVALNKDNINLYRIRFGWLGVAPVLFEIMSPDGNFVTVHTARFANNQNTVSITNPNLPITLDISKSSSDSTNLSITSGCWVAGVTTSNSPTFSGIDNISTLGDSVVIPAQGLAGLVFSISGVWSGTLLFQYSIDGQNWQNDSVLSSSLNIFTFNTTTNQTFQTNISGFKQYRIISTAWTSGLATITFNCDSHPPIITTQNLITDSNNNGPASVKSSNSSATVIDSSLVVALSPNSNTISFKDSFGALQVPSVRNINGSWTINVVDDMNREFHERNTLALESLVDIENIRTNPVVTEAIPGINDLGMVVRHAGPLPTQSDIYTSGYIAALQKAVSISLNGTSTLIVNIFGVFTGTLTFQYSMDGMVWIACSGLTTAGALVATAAAAGTFIFTVGGYVQFRTIATAWTSGQANITYNGSAGINLLPAMQASTVIQGAAAAVANSWFTKISDAANGPVAVKASGITPLTTDPSLVVSLSPNTFGLVGAAPKTNAVPIASLDITNTIASISSILLNGQSRLQVNDDSLRIIMEQMVLLLIDIRSILSASSLKGENLSLVNIDTNN